MSEDTQQVVLYGAMQRHVFQSGVSPHTDWCCYTLDGKAFCGYLRDDPIHVSETDTDRRGEMMNVHNVDEALCFLAEQGWYLWRVNESRFVQSTEKYEQVTGWGFARSGGRAHRHWPSLHEAITGFLDWLAVKAETKHEKFSTAANTHKEHAERIRSLQSTLRE